MMPWTTRVALAKDVLYRLDEFEPTTIDYCASEDEAFCCAMTNIVMQRATSLLLTKRTCRVCATGALFVAHLARHGCVNPAALRGHCHTVSNTCFDIGGRAVFNELSHIFTEEQLHLIEDTFSNWEPITDDAATLNAIAVFRREYSTPRPRLKAICKNMIKHNGKLVL